MISKEKVYSEIQKSGNLPTLPEILLKLLEACDNENTPISEIASIISKDPVLSLKVLQLVNSAYYGLRKKFKSVEQAVVYLGANSSFSTNFNGQVEGEEQQGLKLTCGGTANLSITVVGTIVGFGNL